MKEDSEPRLEDDSIRSISPADTESLAALSGRSGDFKTEDLGAIQEMLDAYHATKVGSGHQVLTYDEGGDAARHRLDTRQ